MPAKKIRFIPFSDDSAVFSLADLTVENKGDALTLYGNLDIEATREGLARARALHDLFGQAVAALEAKGDLPAALERVAPETVANPLA